LYESVLPRVVASVQRFFREVAAVDLPPLEDLGDERLRWLVFPSREQFDGWHSGRGVRNPGAPYVQAGADGLVVTHLDDVLGDSLAWLAATQCLARWKRHFCQQDDDAMADARGLPREPVTRDDRRLQCSYSWLERGLQSRFADAGWTATMDRRPIAGHPTGGEYAFVKREMDRSELWPLEDMLFADVPQVWVRARERGWENLATRLDRLHAAQSFVLVDTLLNGEGGRWREGFAALLRREIRGVSGKVYLLEAFGLPRRSDAPEVKRWIAEVEKACLDRLVPAEPK
jgi:hypothetical protein